MDISNFIEKWTGFYRLIRELITNLFLMLSICITTGILLFVPETNTNFDKAIQENVQLILAFFLISVIVLFAMLLRYLYVLFHICKYLNHLSPNEKKVLRQFMSKKEKVLYFSMQDEGIMSLYENLIVTLGSVGGLTEGRKNQETYETERPFLLDYRAVDILKKNKKLLG